MNVVILQSNYIPWRGYFDLVHDADLFIFLDDLQYTKNDWRNRNKLKTPRGAQWLTIPVGSRLSRRLDEVTLPADGKWAVEHWRRIQELYERAPFFSRYREFFRDVYEGRAWERLSELNQYLVVTIARDFLGCATQFENSSSYGLTSRRQDKVLDLLRLSGATRYISGPSAKGYLDEERVRDAGVELVWKDYSGYPDYPQFHPPFEGAVSIIDLLFQVGPESPRYIWGWRSASRSAP